MRGKGVILLSLLLIMSAVLIITPAESRSVARTEQAPMPTWHVGDMWNYSASMYGDAITGDINIIIVSLETVSGYDVYNTTTHFTYSGTVGSISVTGTMDSITYYSIATIAIVKEITTINEDYEFYGTYGTYYNHTVTTYTPPKNSTQFPITVGKQWHVNVNSHVVWECITTLPWASSDSDESNSAVAENYTCVRNESVCVAAGTYNTYVINAITETGNETSYYAPEVRNMVKSRLYNETGALTIEMNLVSYSVSLPLIGSISGRVTTDSTPLNNTIVTAYYACNNSPAGNDTTDENGDYVILNLPEGAYNVTASKWGYQSNTTTNVNVIAGQETQNINFTLILTTTTTGTITGHVYVSGTTTGIQDANVSINASKYATTDANGVYTLSSVAQGTHTVTATAVDYAPLSAVINVTVGQTSFCNFTLTLLSETGNITGVVKDENNHTLSGATVSIVGTTHSNTTDSNGLYTISAVSAGTYNVTASKTGYVSSTQTNVVVTAKNTTELNLVLTISVEEQRGSISGTIKDKNSNPVAGATVKAYYANDTVAGTAYTNSTGGYTLSNLLPGTYTVKVSKTGFQEYSTSVTVGANQTVTSKDATLTSETGGVGAEGKAEGGIGISGYWWVGVVIAVIIVVVIVVLKKRGPVERGMPARREIPPAREEKPFEEPVPEKKFCIKCGKQISKTAVFCPYCGHGKAQQKQ